MSGGLEPLLTCGPTSSPLLVSQHEFLPTCSLSLGGPALPDSPSPSLPPHGSCPPPGEMRAGGPSSTITLHPWWGPRCTHVRAWVQVRSISGQTEALAPLLGLAAPWTLCGQPQGHFVGSPDGASCLPSTWVPSTSQRGRRNPLGVTMGHGFGQQGLWEEEINFPAPG